MSAGRQYSALFDPMLLHSKSALATGESFLAKIRSWDWGFILINIFLPIAFLLYIAFTLRNRYDQKRARYQEYLVVDDF